MSSPWQTMPDFVDGSVVDEGDLDPIVTNVNLLRQSGRVTGGRIISSAGTIVTTSGTTEANIPNLAIPTIPVLNGAFYTFSLQVYGTYSAASNSFLFRVRETTALSGAVITSAPLVTVVAAFDDTKTIVLPWKSTSTTTKSFFVSVQRIAGAGLVNIVGDLKTAFWIEQIGDDASSVWALT